jgi:pimeloyl-ACP methyl ester carboxylesterase
MTASATTHRLAHNRIQLALHTLRESTGRALLLLHGLGERSPASLPLEAAEWPGPVYALDFTGHGASSIPHGGGYTCELLMGDVDTALAHIGSATVVGRGLGAYIALLIAGGRPQRVRGAILRDGPGLAGGGSASSSASVPFVDVSQPAPPDPFAMVELSTDIRPRDYACSFARQAAQFSGLTRPLTLCARERPGWLDSVVRELDLELMPLAQALAWYAREES